MALASTIRLFQIEPDLIRFLSGEERAEAATLEMPVRLLPKGVVDVDEMLARTGSFGAMLLDGMLLRSMSFADHTGLRLLGPGDMLSLSKVPSSVLVVDGTCRATVPTRLVLLDRQVLRAVRRWPRLVAGLHVRSGELSERLLTQLIICQLPRVDDRLLSLLWLLAESWGHVTAAGTVLPVSLTHEALGGLVGARRPTVTLAIGELAAAGSILRQDGGWLLLRHPESKSDGKADGHKRRVEDPRPIEVGAGGRVRP